MKKTNKFGLRSADDMYLKVDKEMKGFTATIVDEKDEQMYPMFELPDGYWKKDFNLKLIKRKAKEAGKRHGIDMKEFDDDFTDIVMAIQETYDYQRENEKEEVARKKKAIANNPEHQELSATAREWLTRSDFLSLIDRVIHYYLVGETKNALTILLVIISSKTTEPANIRETGESATGKTHLAVSVANLFPEDDVIVRTGFSEKAVWNKGEPVEGEEDRRVWNLSGKTLVILEEATCEEFLEQVRPVLSHDKDRVIYEVTNTESKERSTLKVEIEGWPAYIGLQVGQKMDEQEQTRSMSLTPDSGADKYREAIEFDAIKSESPWRQKKIKYETEVLRTALGMLKQYPVLIPHRVAIQKYFPHQRKRNMRDWKNFKALCEAFTILYQYQRPTINIDGVDFLIAAPSDIEAALLIMEGALSETLAGLGTREQKFWNKINGDGVMIEGYRSLMKKYEAIFKEQISETTLRRKYIEPLKDKGLMEIEDGQGRKPSKFRACGNLSTISTNYKKLVEAASSTDLETSTFGYLLRTTERVYTHLSPRNGHGDEQIDGPTMDHFKEVWKYLCMVNVVDNNRTVLERGYDQDYRVVRPKSTLGDKVDIKTGKTGQEQVLLDSKRGGLVDKEGQDPSGPAPYVPSAPENDENGGQEAPASPETDAEPGQGGDAGGSEPPGASSTPDNGSKEEPSRLPDSPVARMREVASELGSTSKMEGEILNALSSPLKLGQLQYVMDIGDANLSKFTAGFEKLRESGAIFQNDKDEWDVTK